MITTARLTLRQWRPGDLAPFAAMNADPEVREYFPGLLTNEQSDAAARHFQAGIVRNRFGLYAAELRATGEFIGFIGLQTMDFAIPGVAQPAVEIGWRLARAHWGKGLATEGARAMARHALDELRLEEIVAITVPANVRSRRIMEKLGMIHVPSLDFDHPRIPEGHPLRRHVLYVLRRPASHLATGVRAENLPR
jgi:RimJ/RimL family protein N-acetyltransferase